jgi:hypothetical protein
VTGTKATLWDGERLALFANAEGRDEVESFRASHNDFFPAGMWERADLPVPGEPFFNADFSGALSRILGPSAKPKRDELRRVPYWWGLQQALRRAWEQGFPLEWCVILISLAEGETPFHVWPYQRAVMFLGVEPWRARFCGVCGKQFVADKPRRVYCSSGCSGKARRGSRAASWKRHGKKWRTRYGRKKDSGKSSRRAKR